MEAQKHGEFLVKPSDPPAYVILHMELEKADAIEFLQAVRAEAGAATCIAFGLPVGSFHPGSGRFLRIPLAAFMAWQPSASRNIFPSARFSAALWFNFYSGHQQNLQLHNTIIPKLIVSAQGELPLEPGDALSEIEMDSSSDEERTGTRVLSN